MEQAVDRQPQLITANLDNLMAELENLGKQLVGIRDSRSNNAQRAQTATPNQAEFVVQGK